MKEKMHNQMPGKEEDKIKLSYESDGLMGQDEQPQHASENLDGEPKDFFNVTQSSE